MRYHHGKVLRHEGISKRSRSGRSTASVSKRHCSHACPLAAGAGRARQVPPPARITDRRLSAVQQAAGREGLVNTILAFIRLSRTIDRLRFAVLSHAILDPPFCKTPHSHSGDPQSRRFHRLSISIERFFSDGRRPHRTDSSKKDRHARRSAKRATRSASLARSAERGSCPSSPSVQSSSG
jgi:hypothetical protein